MTIRRKLLSFGSMSTDVRLGFGALDELPKFLSGAVGKPSRAYVLSSDDIDPVHIETVRRALVDSGFNAAVRCIAASDALGAETALAGYPRHLVHRGFLSRCRASLGAWSYMTIRRKLLSFGSMSTDVRLGFGALDELPKFLSGAVGKPSRAYVLSSDDIDPVHIETVRRALVDSGFNAAVRCIAASDALGAETALAQYAELSAAELSAAGITAEDLIVGVGGDEACSLASYISRTWCGGVSCALVPTTLDAMIRCST